MVRPVSRRLPDPRRDRDGALRKIKIVKLNVDDNQQIAMKYQITSIPAMKVFKGGEVVKTIIGAKPKPAIEADLAEFLA